MTKKAFFLLDRHESSIKKVKFDFDIGAGFFVLLKGTDLSSHGYLIANFKMKCVVEPLD